MTTPHHFTYLSNSEEIQILHKSVDLAEKDFDRGRIQVNTKHLVSSMFKVILGSNPIKKWSSYSTCFINRNRS